ncbi:amino acid transporter [Lindgomyces ingoldianus]|uniref:Amino acid transporter n=1 Tax=Lindgomyces ingoldianus TaxID=673940 RepID=A0ACB6QVH8_9PLEO|nr:amino acid transporter [Lindgomyces ingoldianus]KAF2471024.1 amino acid transporter [Lindgomyces ingoldianus]
MVSGGPLTDEKISVEEEFEKRRGTIVSVEDGVALNASGHKDQLKRQYGLFGICGLALNIDNAWIALGGSVTLAIANGGAPGVLYELIVACSYYGVVAACIAELASAIPSAGGVYHYASVTPGLNYGRVFGFFAGSLNFFGWLFDYAAITQIVANICVQLYLIFHPDLEIQPWHTFVAYVLITLLVASVCIFANRSIPTLQHIGLMLVVVGGLVTVIVLAAMPKVHASNSFVWKDFDNITGWPDGVAFLTGVLNGAFTIGTVDAITHLAEEFPNPKVDLPKGVAAQIILGFLTAFCFAIALFYSISDLDAVINSNGAFPLAAIYSQATGNKGGTFGLLFIVLLSLLICLVGTLLTCSRIWWSLARDNATPFPHFFSNVNEKLSCPIPAALLCSVISIGLGAITLGSKTAFTDLAGSFIILTSTSYALAIGPNLFTGRKNVPAGPFHMGSVGFVMNALAVLFIIFFNIMYCFPFGIPTTVSSMNYNSVILVGVTALTTIWWFIHGSRKYPGPRMQHMFLDGIEKS